MATAKSKTRKKKLYTKSDYSSGDGMLTYVWGPALWHVLHTLSFNYPTSPTDADKKHYSQFIKSLQYVLPCKYCRTNLTENFKKCPILPTTMENRDSFSRYVYNLHETINTMLKKQSGLTYDNVRDRYEHFRARCLTSTPSIPNPMSVHSKGCTEPLVGKKSKCILRIVPHDDPSPPFAINSKCIPKRIKSLRTKRR
jgi:hypothetical protein